MDGNFTIQVQKGKTLVFSYLGYKNKEVLANSSRLKITLHEDNKVLDDVVVVGYGVQKKSSVTGAISQVKKEDMENRTITNAKSALQGKTAVRPQVYRLSLLLLVRVHHQPFVSVVSLPMVLPILSM